MEARLLAKALLSYRKKLVERHGQVVVLDEDLPLEVEPWQEALPWRVRSVVGDPSIGRTPLKASVSATDAQVAAGDFVSAHLTPDERSHGGVSTSRWRRRPMALTRSETS